MLNVENKEADPAGTGGARSGFARSDLLALVLCVGLLAGIALPGLALSKGKGRTLQCMDNLRALLKAWRSYADDNNERLVGASGWSIGSTKFENWSGGSWLTLNNASDPHNWDHESFTGKSPLWPYLNSTAIFRCPSDPSTAINLEGRVVSRIRSYSLNNWVGGPGWSNSGLWVPQSPSGWRGLCEDLGLH